MLEARGKDFWFAGSDGVFRLPADEIDGEDNGRETPLDFERFGHAGTPFRNYGAAEVGVTS
jgi:hypothetical protein